MKKILSLAACMAMVTSLIVPSASAADDGESGGVQAFIADRTAIVGSYEGNDPLCNQDTGAVHWSNFSGNWGSGYENDMEKGTTTVTYTTEAKAKRAAVVLPKSFSAADAKKLVVGLKAVGEGASRDWHLYYKDGVTITGSNWGSTESRTATPLSFVPDGKFREFEWDITPEEFVGFSGNIQRIQVQIPSGTFPVELEVAYIRFVNENYNEVELKDKQGDCNHLDDIMRFRFTKPLDRETVKAENIMLNDVPATYIFENKETDTDSDLRVRLGALRTASRYTVTFPGLKYADGTAVDEEFSFATEGETIPVYPDSVTAYHTSRDGILAAWEGGDNSGGTWSNGNWTKIEYEYRTETETEAIKFNNSASPIAYLMFDEPIADAADVSKIIVGVKSNQDADFKLFYRTGRATTGWSEAQSSVLGAVKINKGNGEFKEYEFPVNEENFKGFSGAMQSFRFDVSKADGAAKVDFDKGLDVEIAYIRFVNNDYKSRNAVMESFSKDYSKLDEGLRFVFPKDLDLSTVNTQNVTINGFMHPEVLLGARDNEFSVRMGVLPANMRCRVKFPGIKYSDGTDVEGQFIFTTNGAGFKCDENASGALPVTTYELVSGFETPEETPLNGILPSGEITAVTGGLCSVAAEAKTYMLCLALYDNYMLTDVVYKAVDVPQGGIIGQQSMTLTVPETADDADRYSVKAFLWEDGTLNPVIKTLTPCNNDIRSEFDD